LSFAQDETFVEQIIPKPLPENYLYLASKYFDGFVVYVDTRTFQPVVLPGYGGRLLTPEDIEELAAWRSREGVPWTTWAYEKELTLASREAHNVRSLAATYIIPRETFIVFFEFMVDKEGITLTGEQRQAMDNGQPWPESISGGNNDLQNFKITRWFRDNVSAIIADMNMAVVETFAWYSAPGYEKGSLPPELEAGLELVKEGVVPDWVQGIDPARYGWVTEAARFVKEGEVKPPSGAAAASLAGQIFFYRENLPVSLEYLKVVREKISLLEENPGNFAETFAALEALSDIPPDTIPANDVDYLKGYLENLSGLRKVAGMDGDEIMTTQEYYGQAVSEFRENHQSYVDWYPPYLDYYIARWSSLID